MPRHHRLPRSARLRYLLPIVSVLPTASAWALCNGGVDVTSTLVISSNCSGDATKPLTLGTGADVTINADVTVDNDRFSTRNGDPVAVAAGATAIRLVNHGLVYTPQQWGVTVQGTLGSLVNTGTIRSDSRRAVVINGTVGTFTNTGTLSGPFADVTTSGVLQTFNNLQGAGNAAGPVTYAQALPTHYNIIIDSPTHYGQLDNAGATGSLQFGVYETSTVAAGTYSSVLTGFSGANLTGPLTGTFGRYTWNLNLASGTTWDLVFVANPVSYLTYATTPNAASVARLLESIANAPATTQGAALTQQIDALSPSSAQAAFHSLAGSTHATASSVAQSMTRGFAAQLGGGGTADTGARVGLRSGAMQYASLDLVQAAPRTISDAGPGRAPDARGLWVQALGTGGRIASDGNADGARWRGDGFALGYEQPLSGGWIAGAAFGYSRARWDALGGTGASGRIETPQVGVYARSTGDGWRTRIDASYADHDFTADRVVVIGVDRLVAQSTHGGKEWSAGLQFEKPMVSGPWQLLPVVGLRYANLRERGFTETGAGAANLSVQGRTTQNAVLSTGVHAGRDFDGAPGRYEMRAIASYLTGDNDAPLTASLAGQAGGFTVTGAPLKRAALTLGGSVQGRMGRGATMYADASYELRGSGQNAFQLGAGVRMDF
ncbi:MAG: autotransporter outer membrane beta-barrel domain-containing protein [Burkholderiales bacterium]|nr:autotransporter outer membrane beta-barrel domain-containing protein [Burkholderiales bacterium]